MKKILLFLCCVMLATLSEAQGVVTYYDGTPAMEKKLTDVEGTELLYPDWVQGRILTKDGKVFRDQKLKYNQLEDKFYFLGNTGVSMMFTTPVREIVLGDSASGGARVFRNGFPAISKFTPDSYYEVLVSGKNQLLKKDIKNLIETKDYNSPIVKKQILDDVHYYVYNGEKLFQVKKDKEVILEAFKEKAAGINAYLSATKPNLKKEADLKLLVSHINTL